MLKVAPHPNYPPEEGRYVRGNDPSPVAVVLNCDADKIPLDLVRGGRPVTLTGLSPAKAPLKGFSLNFSKTSPFHELLGAMNGYQSSYKKEKDMRNVKMLFVAALLVGIGQAARGQEAAQPDQQNIDGAVIYDHDPSTTLGDDVFGTVIADFSASGRCSHAGPVCMEYANGTLVAFYANTSSHNTDGWSEYAFSEDGGRTWDRNHPFPYSHEAYKKDRTHPVVIEEGLVTEKGTAVLILTHFHREKRIGNSIMRSHDHGTTWSDPAPVANEVVGYPAAVAVKGTLNYVLFDCSYADHELWVSADDGQTWRKQSTPSLQKDAGYGAMCFMKDGRLLAGAYVRSDEHHFYYCISDNDGRTWGKQQKAYLDKKVRDPELAYLDGKYYLHGRSGQHGEGSCRFVIYQSNDGIRWKNGVIVSGDRRHPDGYSHNCIINKYNNDVPNELMIEYSIICSPRRTSEYVFFVKPEHQQSK